MYEIKFGFATGYNLVSAAFQPNRTGRGIENQPLYERIPTGFYSAEPATDLVVGDTVLAYELETVYYEDDPVVVLTEETVLYEGEQVYWEGAMVFDFDSVSNNRVNWMGNVVGSGEYESVTDISTTITNIYNSQTDVHNVYDERDGDGAVVGAGIESEIITDC